MPRLDHLVHRIAVGDLCALVELQLAMDATLRGEIEKIIIDGTGTDGVIASTMVEVWWLAAVHDGSGHDAAAWIHDIAARRATDRLRSHQSIGPSAEPRAIFDHEQTGVLLLAHLVGEPGELRPEPLPNTR